MKSKTILILGAGVGGITVANALRRRLGPEHRLVVVDKNADYVFTPSLLWVMVGWRKPDHITKSLSRLLHPGIEFIRAGVQGIDPDKQRVTTSQGELTYDYLVIALGASLAPEALPGFHEAAYTPYDLQGASELWAALESFEGGRVGVLVSSKPYKCPAAPYETALLLDDYLRKRDIRGQSQVEVYTPETLPMGVAGPAMGNAVVGMLESRDIRFNPELEATRIEEGRRVLQFSGGEDIPFDLLAGVPPHRPPRPVIESPLANEMGWLPVDRRTLRTRYENVFAIGDVASVTLANGKPLPKAGVFADGQAHIVARRITDDIHGDKVQAEFDGLGFCWIETGGGSAGFASGDFYAEPDPHVPLPRSGRIWHWGKVLFEKYWLSEGFARTVLRLGLNLGSKVLGVPVTLKK